MAWVRWLVGFFGGAVVLKVLYYDVKVQSDMQSSLNKTLIESGGQIKSDILNLVAERLKTHSAHNNLGTVGVKNLPSSQV